MKHTTSGLQGEQAKAQTRKKIAIAVAKTMSVNPVDISKSSGFSIETIRRNMDHVAIIFAQESRKLCK